MESELLKLLRKVDTPTVCNAIEVVEGKRGFDRFTRGTMQSSAPDAGAIVGFARTAKIAAVAPPTEPAEVIKARRMDYYRYMASGPRPAIAVVEDLDFPKSIGAFWGEINTTVHKGFGLSGSLTNGVMRDLGDLPDGFPVIAGTIGPSHGFVHVREIETPVTIFGLCIKNGDLCGWLPFCKYLFRAWCFVRSSLVFGLFARRTWPLALPLIAASSDCRAADGFHQPSPIPHIEQQAFWTKLGASRF